jgi:hypothetical protein
MKGKLKAYTLLELTIAMLLTGLVISITYASYNLIVKSHLSFSKKNNELTVLTTLDYLLKKDIAQAVLITKTATGIILIKRDVRVHYQFQPDFIVRVTTRSDTFKVKTDDIIATFEGTPVNDNPEPQKLDHIDELQFNVHFHQEKIPYIYHKVYSAVNLIPPDPDASN